MHPETDRRILLRMKIKKIRIEQEVKQMGGNLKMDHIILVKYEDKYEKAWDRFVLKESINGTFLQTRNFLNYHPAGRFEDNSLLFLKGSNIIAVIPAHVEAEGDGKHLVSHKGSTFGGIVLGKKYKKIKDMQIIFKELDNYLKENNFTKITLKLTSSLFSVEESELIEYFLFLNDYVSSCEIGYCIDFRGYKEDIPMNFTSSKRRDYKYSLRNPLEFKVLEKDEEIACFYQVLENNMKKFDTVPVHTLDEIKELKNDRLNENIRFYGVYFENRLIAGGMIFYFEKKVFHTQYLATDQDMLYLFPNEFLYENLIETARNEGFEKLSFGTSTLEHGRVLNQSLAQFKEGFGTREYVNRTFTKKWCAEDKMENIEKLPGGGINKLCIYKPSARPHWLDDSVCGRKAA